MNEVSLFEVRRRHVADVTTRLVARSGMEGVTVRDVAAEAGYSTHVVSHYFENKKELLQFTLRESSARSVQRMKTAIRNGCGISECLEAILPLDEDRTIDSRVWLAFWASALRDREIAEEQIGFGAIWRQLILVLLRARGVLDAKSPKPDQELLAMRLLTLVAGIGVHGALGVWTPEEQRKVLAAEVASILASTGGVIEAPPSSADRRHERAIPKQVAAIEAENEKLRRMLVDMMIENAALKEASAR